LTQTPPARLLRDSVGLATRFVREHWRFVLAVSGIAAAAVAALSALSEVTPALSIVSTLGAGFLQAALYTVFIAAALMGVDAAQQRWLGDSARVWAAMIVIGFFLFIVFFALSLPVSMVLFAGPLARYAPELERATGNSEAVMAIFTRFANENPGPVLLAALIMFVVWMLLTSRLYLAAPATVERQRIQTFETWAWTRGMTMRILGARLLLLGPAYVLTFALGHLIGRALGLNTLDMAAVAAAAESNPAGFIAYVFASGFIAFALYSSLEAALSAYLYKALRPPSP
jgi:hypothetical protein